MRLLLGVGGVVSLFTTGNNSIWHMGRQMLAKTDGVGGMTTSSVATRHFRRWRLACRLQLAVGRGSEATVGPLHSHTTSM